MTQTNRTSSSNSSTKPAASLLCPLAAVAVVVAGAPTTVFGAEIPFSLAKPIDNAYFSATSVVADDVDGDGDLDILGAANTADTITWWENRPGNGATWVEHTVSGAFDGALAVAVADVDGDGDADVLGAAINADTIAWWQNGTPRRERRVALAALLTDGNGPS